VKPWTIEPRDPLVVRDGRPPAAGMPSSRSLDFPWPSTVAGLSRTRAGLGPDGRFDEQRIGGLLQESLKGPWLVELDASGAAHQLALPAPRDAVAFRDAAGAIRTLRLAPQPLPASVKTSLPPGLTPLGFVGDAPRGKAVSAGAFWRWSAVERWLTTGASPSDGDVFEPLAHERRFHVAIDPETGTASDGKLFVSDGLRFWGGRRLALGFLASDGLAMAPGAVKLGGEGRASWLRAGGVGLPACPSALVDAIEKTRRARVLLATPAIFEGGALPRAGSLFDAPIIAARVDRPDVISGWDHARNQPRASRRMVGAGTVYWVNLESVSDVRGWVAKAWAQAVPEQAAQDQRDGFGLAFVGVGS